MEKLEEWVLTEAGSGQYRGTERAEVSHRESFYICALKYTYYTPTLKYICTYAYTCSHTDYYMWYIISHDIISCDIYI